MLISSGGNDFYRNRRLDNKNQYQHVDVISYNNATIRYDCDPAGPVPCYQRSHFHCVFNSYPGSPPW